MNWTLIILLSAQCLFNFLNSQIDAYLIFKNKTIAHGINFGLYAALIVGEIYVTDYVWWYIIIFCFSALCNRQVTFDIPLNLRRKLPFDYISLDKPPKALTDRIEIAVFGYNGSAITFSYIILWVLSIAALFIFH